MLRIIKKRHYCETGFTLVELLVAIAIVGIISIISVQSLYDSVSIRSKQYSIEDSSESYRYLVKLITNAVMEAQNITILSSSEIKIVGEDICQTIIFDGNKSILHSKTTGASCIPPDIGDSDFTTLTDENILITDFSLSPVGESPKVIKLDITGLIINSLGEHPFSYQTTMTPRVSI